MNFSGTWNAFVVLLVKAFVAVVDGMRTFGDGMLSSFFSAAGTFFPAVDWSPLQQSLAWGNHFAPLSECLTMATAYFGLWCLVFVYRFAKSWIPTVAS